MSPRKEYEGYVVALQASSSGREILALLAQASRQTSTYLLQECTGEWGSFVKAAGAFVGSEGMAQILEQNAILFCGRILAKARCFDELGPDKRMSSGIGLLVHLLQELQTFADRGEHVRIDERDKKARRQHRGTIQDADHAVHEDVCQSEKTLIDRCVKVILPHASASLLLPSGAGFFSGKIDAMLKNVQDSLLMHVQRLLSRERKTDLLCRALAYIYIWVCKGCPSKEVATFKTPAQLVDRILPVLQGAIKVLFPSFERYATYLPMEKIVTSFCSWLEDVSLEESLLHLMQYFLLKTSSEYTLRTTKELDFVIDKLCSDEMVRKALIKKCLPAEEPEGETAVRQATPLDMILMGLQSTTSQLQAFPWKEILERLFDEVRSFSLSVYCEKAMFDWMTEISEGAN